VNGLEQGKILVTGGAGFIGSALIWGLNRLGLQNILVCDQLGADEKWRNLAPLQFDDYMSAPKLIESIEAGSPTLQEIRWVQEEPENMGGYPFVHVRMHGSLPDGVRLSHAARSESGSPAAGSSTIHEQEQEELLEEAFAPGAAPPTFVAIPRANTADWFNRLHGPQNPTYEALPLVATAVI